MANITKAHYNAESPFAGQQQRTLQGEITQITLEKWALMSLGVTEHRRAGDIAGRAFARRPFER